MSSLRDFYKSIVDAPGTAIHAVIDEENQVEQSVMQAGVNFAEAHGVIAQDTGQTIIHGEQVVQGAREAVADLASGLTKTALDPVGTVGDIGAAIGDAYTKRGGGVDGALDAANVVNPLYHAAVAGYEAYQAAGRGDYKAVGKQGTNAAAGVVGTAGLAVGGAALAEGALGAGETVATDAAAADATAGQGTGQIVRPPPESGVGDPVELDEGYSDPVGRKGSPLENAPYQKSPARNVDTVIAGRNYGGHALDQMQNRGLTPRVVENTIQKGVLSDDPIPGRIRHYDSGNNITVVTEGDKVVTVVNGKM